MKFNIFRVHTYLKFYANWIITHLAFSLLYGVGHRFCHRLYIEAIWDSLLCNVAKRIRVATLGFPHRYHSIIINYPIQNKCPRNIKNFPEMLTTIVCLIGNEHKARKILTDYSLVVTQRNNKNGNSHLDRYHVHLSSTGQIERLL